MKTALTVAALAKMGKVSVDADSSECGTWG
jgi:hypothetical protein